MQVWISKAMQSASLKLGVLLPLLYGQESQRQKKAM